MRDLRSIARCQWYDPTTFGICHVPLAIIGGSAAIAGVGAYSANRAAKAETNAANQANTTLQNEQGQVRSDLSPYRAGGQQDFNAYNSLIGASGNPNAQEATLQSMPGYQFTLQQGLKSTQNAAAARGLGVSGAALKGAASYATGLANSNYGTFANNLLGGAQVGENAAAQTGQLGTQSALGQAQNTIGAGNAQAAGIIGGSNALSSGLNNLFLYNALQGGQGGLFGKPGATNNTQNGSEGTG